MIHRTKLQEIDAAAPIEEPPPAPPQITGLGDIVHLVAQPIARGIDRVFRTDIQNCSGCAARRAKLNRALPLTSQPPHAD